MPLPLNLSALRYVRPETIRRAVGVIILVLFLLPLLLLGRVPLTTKLEAIAFDLRLRMTMPNSIEHSVVIVDIDEKSLEAEGRWPWPRNRLAHLVDNLFDRYQIRALGFDVFFSEEDRSSGLPTLERLAREQLKDDAAFQNVLAELRPTLEYDQQFARSLQGRPVVLGIYFTPEAHRSGVLPPPLFTSEAGLKIEHEGSLGYGANIELLQQAAADAGHTNPAFDSDNVVRRVPLLHGFEGKYYEALSLALARTALKGKDIRAVRDKDDLTALEFAGVRIPVNERGLALVPYRGVIEGGRLRGFEYVSATDVLSGKVPVESLKEKIVLVGTTAPGLRDLRSTPFDPALAGVEIHANLVAGMLNGQIPEQPANAAVYEAGILLIAGLLLIFGASSKHSGLLLGVGLGAIVLAIGLNVWLWVARHQDIGIASTVVALSALFVWNTLVGYFAENMAKRQLSTQFGQYIPKERVAVMVESGESFGLEGESREMTVMFTDIRNFTTIAEQMKPAELSKMMNAYFTPLTGIIHQHGGTIDKYIGDAIMAFWGAPLPDPSHARDAVKAALAMQRKLVELEEEFKARGWPALKTGIGINTGTMTVGDMGSEFRRAYSVIGDAVNLASRLEGQSKEYGVGTVISESTRAAVPDLVCRELDRIRVKGKTQPIAVFEPIGFKGEVSERKQTELQEFEPALAAYRSLRFSEAALLFSALQQRYPRRKLYRIYLDRAITYQAAPPPADWDGVEEKTSK